MPASARSLPPAWNRARKIATKSRLHPAVSSNLIGPKHFVYRGMTQCQDEFTYQSGKPTKVKVVK